MFVLGILFFISLLKGSQSYLKLPLGTQRFNFKKNEYHKKIKLDLPEQQMSIVKKINGFYGLIGPDVKMKDANNIYKLFMGDGIIQGCFFDNGELTFTRQYVKTDKLLYEEKNGKIPQNNFYHLLFMLLNEVKLLPNILGLANTVIMKIKNFSRGINNPQNRFYALYERDLPYEINIDFINKQISTIGKVDIYGLKHFSAHSIVNDERDMVESIDYDVMKNHFIYHLLNNDLQLYKTINIKTQYMPVIHDFISTNYSVIFTDSPLTMEHSKMNVNEIPVSLVVGKPTFINVLNKVSSDVSKYQFNNSFYVFHYAQWEEDDYHISIYAPVYDELELSKIDIHGFYRKIYIHKFTGEVTMEKNPVLEKLNLDFPVKFGEDKVILRNIKDRICDGFVICKGLDIVHKIFLENRFACGEHRVFEIEGKPYLISYTFNINNNKEGFITIIDLDTYKIIEIPLGTELYFGFHSIYCDNK